MMLWYFAADSSYFWFLKRSAASWAVSRMSSGRRALVEYCGRDRWLVSVGRRRASIVVSGRPCVCAGGMLARRSCRAPAARRSRSTARVAAARVVRRDCPAWCRRNRARSGRARWSGPELRRGRGRRSRRRRAMAALVGCRAPHWSRWSPVVHDDRDGGGFVELSGRGRGRRRPRWSWRAASAWPRCYPVTADVGVDRRGVGRRRGDAVAGVRRGESVAGAAAAWATSGRGIFRLASSCRSSSVVGGVIGEPRIVELLLQHLRLELEIVEFLLREPLGHVAVGLLLQFAREDVAHDLVLALELQVLGAAGPGGGQLLVGGDEVGLGLVELLLQRRGRILQRLVGLLRGIKLVLQILHLRLRPARASTSGWYLNASSSFCAAASLSVSVLVFAPGACPSYRRPSAGSSARPAAGSPPRAGCDRFPTARCDSCNFCLRDAAVPAFTACN